MRKPTPSWKIIGIFFTKRYLFCFKHKLHLKSDQKSENHTPISFNLTLVKCLRNEKRWNQCKKVCVPWTRFQEKCSKVKNLAFRLDKTPAEIHSFQSQDFSHFRDFHPKLRFMSTGLAMPRAAAMAAHSRICLRDCVSSRLRISHRSVNVSWTDALHALFTNRYLFCFKR